MAKEIEVWLDLYKCIISASISKSLRFSYCAELADEALEEYKKRMDVVKTFPDIVKWTPWNGSEKEGKPFPIEPDKTVSVIFRSGGEECTGSVSQFLWKHYDSDLDIVKYRRIK